MIAAYGWRSLGVGRTWADYVEMFVAWYFLMGVFLFICSGKQHNWVPFILLVAWPVVLLNRRLMAAAHHFGDDIVVAMEKDPPPAIVRKRQEWTGDPSIQYGEEQK